MTILSFNLEARVPDDWTLKTYDAAKIADFFREGLGIETMDLTKCALTVDTPENPSVARDAALGEAAAIAKGCVRSMPLLGSDDCDAGWNYACEEIAKEILSLKGGTPGDNQIEDCWVKDSSGFAWAHAFARRTQTPADWKRAMDEIGMKISVLMVPAGGAGDAE